KRFIRCNVGTRNGAGHTGVHQNGCVARWLTAEPQSDQVVKTVFSSGLNEICSLGSQIRSSDFVPERPGKAAAYPECSDAPVERRAKGVVQPVIQFHNPASETHKRAGVRVPSVFQAGTLLDAFDKKIPARRVWRVG